MCKRSPGTDRVIFSVSGTGPVVMVQLQPGEHEKASSGVQRKTCLKRFLSVTDFAGTHSFVAAKGKSDEGTELGRKLRERSAERDGPCDHSMMGVDNGMVSQHSPEKQPQRSVLHLLMMQQQV